MSRRRAGLSVRVRAVLAAAAALTPVLAAASAAGVLVQREDLTRSTTLVAREHAVGLAQQLTAGSRSGNRPGSLPLGGEQDLVQVVTDGRVTAASPLLAGRGPLAAGGSDSSTVVTGVAEGEPDRYVVVTAPVAGRDQYVVAARSLESVDAAVASTTRLVVVGSVLVVVLVSGLTWVLIGRALRPVEDMRRQAAQITQANLSSRLPVPTTGDEVARLAVTMNTMLEDLERAITIQRQFVADASHELRSPIAAVRALYETAHLGHPGGPAGLSGEVLAEVARLEALVSDLLFLARSEVHRRRPVPVDLAAEVAALAARTRRVPVETSVPDHAWVDGDPHALSRMVRNLLDNAERHTASTIEVRVGTTATSVTLTIADDGPGIPGHERERVFRRFVRLDEARARDHGGAGLGLAIVRQIVTTHHGTVTVDRSPRPGIALPGAVFTVTLPRRRST